MDEKKTEKLQDCMKRREIGYERCCRRREVSVGRLE